VTASTRSGSQGPADEAGPEGGRTARRRYLTMMFSDLSESTRLAASMEAEQYAEVLGELRRAYQEVIPKHGGTIVQIQGDGVLAVFGYPEAREDGGRRATEAALELHERVRRLRPRTEAAIPEPLALHTGIHSGLVLCDEGDLVRGRVELLGDATNLAAHLSDVAERDEILVSEQTLGPERHLFEVGATRALRLSGRAEALTVHRILARGPVATRYEAHVLRGLTPFVGRQAEMRALERSLREAVAGTVRCVAVCAPAGLGKTRLMEEFLRRAESRDCQVHRGYCEPYQSAEPLQPFLQMLRALFRLDSGMDARRAAAAVEAGLAAIGPELRARGAPLLRLLSLGERPAAPAGPVSASHESAVAALRDLFDALAATRPQALFVDDWHWADDATHQAIAAIRALAQRRILIVTASRSLAAGDAGTSDAQVLELAPFTEPEALEAIRRISPGMEPFTMGEICRYSGGNPLYIEELCHSAAEAGAERPLGRVASGEAWLSALIESRVTRLPAAQAALVRTAAVIGNVIPSWLLESVTGCAADHPMVRALAAQDLVFPGESPGTLRFKHGIARDVIYDAVGLHERRAIHLRIARTLRAHASAGAVEENLEALAYHFGAAGRSAEAADYAELAGDRAAAASALDRAQAQYGAALSAIDRLEPSPANRRRWISIALRLARACVFDPSREQREILSRAAAIARELGDAPAIAGTEFWLGNVCYALGESRAAIRHCERALAAAQGAGDERLIAEIRATLGEAAAAACDYGRALGLLEEAIVLKRRHRSGTRPAIGLAYTLLCKASVLGDRGQFAQARECFAEALEAVRGVRHAVLGSLFCWQSAVFLWQGGWDDARLAAYEAQRVAEQVRSRYLFAMSRALAAYAGWVATRAPELLQAMLDATQWIEASGRLQYISLCHGWLADALVSRGRYAEARDRAARALRRGRGGDRLGEAMACRAMARAAAKGIGRRPARHYLALAMDAARARGSPHEAAATLLCEAEIALGLGDRQRARALADEAESAFARMDMAWHLAEVARLRTDL
jgi:class 3 adenylate cyclase